jgi:hypothetical protein
MATTLGRANIKLGRIAILVQNGAQIASATPVRTNFQSPSQISQAPPIRPLKLFRRNIGMMKMAPNAPAMLSLIGRFWDNKYDSVALR